MASIYYKFQLKYRHIQSGVVKTLILFAKDEILAKRDAREQLGHGWEFVSMLILED